MIKYAREDVHYLLYIYDRMRQDLVTEAAQQGLESSQFLKSVLKKSCEICLQRYSKPKLKDESYYNLVLRNKLVLSTIKVKLLKNLLKWRFKYAAIEDENPNFVLPNPILFQLIEKQPKNTKELYANFKKIGPILRKYDNELIALLTNTSTEELPNFVTSEKKLQISEIIPEIKLNNKNSTGNLSIEKQNDDIAFKIIKTSIIIPKYIGHFLYEEKEKNQKTSSKITKLNEIKKSFQYENYIEYILNLHPEVKGIFHEAEKQKKNLENVKFSEENNEKTEKIQEESLNPKKDFDFIEFSREKGERQNIKKKEFSLNVDQSKMMAELEKIKEIPESLKEKYGTTLHDKKKKKRDLTNEPEEKTHKKVKIDEKKGSFVNKFAVLNSNEIEEGEEEAVEVEKKPDSQKKIITDEDFEEMSKKIMSIN